MLDIFSTDQANLQSPSNGAIAPQSTVTAGDAFAAAREANDRVDGLNAEYQNQRDFFRQRMDAFTAKTGVDLPKPQDVETAPDDFTDRAWIGAVRTKMDAEAKARNDPSLASPSDQDIAQGGLDLARGAARRQADLRRGTVGLPSLLGSASAGAIASATDPINAASLALMPTGGPLLSTALKMAAVQGGGALIGDVMRYGYRQQVDPDYGVGDVLKDVGGAAATGALFGAGTAVGGHGVRGALLAAGAGAVGGAALGGMGDGAPGAVEGAIGGAALPLAGAGFGLGAKSLGMAWRGLRETRPDVAAAMPLEVRDAGTVAEKAGDVQAQNPFTGPSGEAAHAEAVGKIEADLTAGTPPTLPQSAVDEAAARRGTVFYPGGSVDVRYGLAEHGDLITSHDADFNVRPDYPPELQPRDRGGAPAQDQVASMAGALEPERLGPSPEANAGAPIAGPDGVVESGNGRTLAIGRAYDLGRGEAYRQQLERWGYDTTGFDKPVLVGMRETALDPAARADFAHAANGSAALRMSATEQAMSDARHLDGDTLALAKGPDLAAAANRDFARAVVAKLPAGERGGMLTRDGALSAGGVRRVQAAMTARAFGDPGVLSRALDHPDPNIKAIAGAMTDAAGPWARMRDAATRGDIAGGHDITADVLQAVKAIMRARDEGRPAWEVLNQGDMFQSDTTQLATRMFFRDEAMRLPAGRGRIAEALTSYAEEAAKNTTAGRLFDDAMSPGDVLRRAAAATVAKVADLLDTGAQDVLAMARREPQRMVPAYGGPGGMLTTARKLEETIAYREQEIAAMKADPSRESYPGRLSAFEAHVEALKDARQRFAKPPEPRLFTAAKMIDSGDRFVTTVATDDRLGASDNHKLFRIYDKPNDPAAIRRPSRELGGIRGEVEVSRGDDGRWEVQMVEVAPGMRGQGVATALYGAVQRELGIEMSPSGILLPDGYAFWKRRDPAKVAFHQQFEREDGSKVFYSPKRLAAMAESGGDGAEQARRLFDALPPEARAPETLAAMFNVRKAGDGRGSEAPEARPDLAVRNDATGRDVQAQDVTKLSEMLDRHSVADDPRVDVLQRASELAIGDRLKKIVGEMPVYTVGPAEMRALAEGRMKLQAGYEPAGFYDPRAGHIVALDDALRDPAEASRLMLHEGLHAAFRDTIEGSPAARQLVDMLRDTATAVHFERGGEAADHYGLSNVHEFVSEGFSNPEFQRFLSTIPADDRMVQAFGLDRAPGYSLWDVFVAAVRRILGMAPEQHSLLDATMRLGQRLEDERSAMMRADGDHGVLAMPRRIEADAPIDEDAAGRARDAALSDVKDAISYRINTDRIAQHPNGPLAGFLGILTRDIHEKGGINVEAVQQDYEGRMAQAVEHILEPYGSKMAGLKQDVAGIRDVIRETFGVDTKNATAKAAAHAWSEGIDKWATAEAKRLGKVFAPADDWRVPQFWESRRAQKFGRAALLADMGREVDAGGLKVFDPDTHEEANQLRRQAILEGATDKIVTDASLGGTPGASGSFRTDMRVFRFADGAEGAEAYLRLMDKYGAGRGGYLAMMQGHVGKVARELGLARVLGPGWADVGEKLLQDALLADKRIRAARPTRTMAERLADLPKDTGRFLTSWLESPTKAEAVWQYMSGQSSGVGSELMAGLLSETRAFMTSTRMGSAIVTAVPADAVNWLMAARHNGMDMGRMVSAITDAFLKDNPERREEAARLGIVAHAGADAAIGTKRFEDQFVGDKVMKRLADFVIRAQGLHAWDSAIKRAFPMEFLGAIGQRAGRAIDDLDEPFANFLDRYGLTRDWPYLGSAENALDVGDAKYLHPDRLPEDVRVRLMSAIYDERQFAYLAGGSARVRATSSAAKAGTLAGELSRSVFLFKSFPMTMLSTWGMRAAHEAGAGRIGTLATLVTGMTMAGALAMQARSLLQGKDPRSMKDPFFWGESFLQGGAAGIYGDFFKEAFSRSDTSLTETMMGPLAAIPAGIQGLTSGARRMAEDGEKVNFGAKLAQLLSQNTPGGNLWYTRLIASRLLFDNIQRMIDRNHDASFARQQQRALKTQHQGFFWAPGTNAPGRAPDMGAMLQ